MQTTGPIRLSQIQTLFGGVNPIYLSEYKRGGLYVLNGPAENSKISTTTNLRFSNFYGAKNALPVSAPTFQTNLFTYERGKGGNVPPFGGFEVLTPEFTTGNYNPIESTYVTSWSLYEVGETGAGILVIQKKNLDASWTSLPTYGELILERNTTYRVIFSWFFGRLDPGFVRIQNGRMTINHKYYQ